MPLYVFQCEECEEVTRKLLPSRPKIYNCCCGGKLSFRTNVQEMVIETRDNGVMPRKVEQLKDVEKMVRDRSTDKPGDDRIV